MIDNYERAIAALQSGQQMPVINLIQNNGLVSGDAKHPLIKKRMFKDELWAVFRTHATHQ